MKTPEFNVKDRYVNGYCGCPLCVGTSSTPNNSYEIIEKSFNDSVIFFRVRQYKDERGYFQECWNDAQFKEEIANCNFVQDNMSVSKKNVFRGMHFQYPNHPQAKLVNCEYGRVIDFVIDIRPESIYYGKARGYDLNDPSLFLFIPEGFAHGFYTINDMSKFRYKVSDYRYAEEECGISLSKTIYPHDIITCVDQNNEEFSFSCLDMSKCIIMSKKDANTVSLDEFMQIQKEKQQNE